MRELSRRDDPATAESSTRPPVAHRPRWLRWALVFVPVVLLAAGWTTYTLTREPTITNTIGCYDRADLSGNTTVQSYDGGDPVALCAALWRQGDVLTGNTTPPHLVACVLDTGPVAVFPGDDSTCQQLGLSAAPAGYGSSGSPTGPPAPPTAGTTQP
jgi:hypothetical protein